MSQAAPKSCKRCKSWQPEKTSPRMVALGFASCSHHPLPGRTFSAETSCARFVELPAEQVEARRTAATAAVRTLKESK